MSYRVKTWETFIQSSQMIKKKSQAVLESIAATHDLTVHQMLVMLGISNRHMLSVGDISRELMMHQANASVLCKRMEAMQLIQRIRNAADVRIVNVVLTPQGKQLMDDVISDMESRYHRIVGQAIDFDVIRNGFEELNKLLDSIESENYE